ncbi:MAG: hypothetical protein Q9199_004833 [Rusavskia elegans]
MACRVPVTDVAKAIQCLQADGGVILTGFASAVEVTAVNDDAAPYLEAVAKEILNSFLKTTSVPYNDQADCVVETDPILSAAATMQISPGEQAQDLHRDDFIWQRTHTKSGGSYEPGSDTSMGLIVAGSETTMANGATVVRLTSSRKR